MMIVVEWMSMIVAMARPKPLRITMRSAAPRSFSSRIRS